MSLLYNGKLCIVLARHQFMPLNNENVHQDLWPLHSNLVSAPKLTAT